METQGPGPVGEGGEFPPIEQDEELREQDVTRGDVLDDRVAEGDGLDESESDE